MSDASNRPRVARMWRGRTCRDRADDYEAYNYDAGIKPLIEKAMARIHHLDRDAEFLIELPKSVQILQIRTSHGDTGGETQ